MSGNDANNCSAMNVEGEDDPLERRIDDCWDALYWCGLHPHLKAWADAVFVGYALITGQGPLHRSRDEWLSDLNDLHYFLCDVEEAATEGRCTDNETKSVNKWLLDAAEMVPETD